MIVIDIFLLGLSIGIIFGGTYIYKEDSKVLNSLIEDFIDLEEELDKLKEDLKNDCYVKQEALSVLKFYNGRKWDGTGKELTETWDEFYIEYQKSKVI